MPSLPEIVLNAMLDATTANDSAYIAVTPQSTAVSAAQPSDNDIS
jgi:hypothetical protein